jgi:hypothetical protein
MSGDEVTSYFQTLGFPGIHGMKNSKFKFKFTNLFYKNIVTKTYNYRMKESEIKIHELKFKKYW